ncbi:MAG: enoyl-CoA hydratase-related protein [Dehalococcoidia bacterium]
MNPESYHSLVLSVDDGVALVKLNRPATLNAFDRTLAFELLRVAEEIHAADEVRAVVLTGAGRGFCSGVDIKETAFLGSDPTVNPFQRDRLDALGYTGRLPLAWYEIDKPTIAAVNGVAAGGGFALSLVCDIRLAAESARFYPMFIQRGTSPEVATSWTLPRLIGTARAFEWLYTGDPISGSEAAAIGLVNRTVPDDRLLDEAFAVARKIAEGPPLALRLTRRTIQHGLTRSLREHLPYETHNLGLSIATEDAREGARAIVEKRRPTFTGR